MTRKIKAKDIKPGMEIEWKHGGFYTRCVVGLVEKENLSYPAYSIRAVGSAAGWKTFSEGAEVTVLKEAQPEEPTEFGAKVVVVNGQRFIRADDYIRPWLESEVWTWYTWAHLCEMGPVTVIPDQGWEVPNDSGDNEEVPDRIKEWPEYDESLRKYKWLDRYGTKWHSERHILDTPHSWVTRLPNGRRFDFEKPTRGPWTRVDEAGE